MAVVVLMGWHSARADLSVPLRVESEDGQLARSAAVFFEEAFADGVTDRRISDAIRQFYRLAEAYTVDVWSEPEGLLIRLTTRPVVSEIRVAGARHVSAQEIRTMSGLSEGDPIPPERARRAEEVIRRHYAERGFPNAEAAVSVEARETSRLRRVTVHVREGEQCRVSALHMTFSGPEEEKLRFLRKLGVREGDRCDEDRIRDRVRQAEAYLRGRGYLQASVTRVEFIHRPDGLGAELFLRVRAGLRIEVVFLGNTLYFERNSLLRAAAAVDEERQFSDGWKDATAVYGISEFYRSRGYGDVRVEVSDDVDDRVRRITFRIDRGPKLRLGDVNVVSKGEFQDSFLEREFRARAPGMLRDDVFVAREMPEAARNLEGFLQSQGYLLARVASPVPSRAQGSAVVSLGVTVDEGKRSTLAGWTIEGNRLFDDEAVAAKLGLRAGDPVNLRAIEDAASVLQNEYARAGYKLARVHLPPIEAIGTGEVTYPVRIEEGPLIHIGEVAVRGNYATKDRVVLRELRVRKGDRYDPEKVRESRRNVVRLGFFDRVFVEEPPLDPITHRQDLIVTVAERRKRSVRLRPGFSTEDGARGAVDLGYVNIAGTGRTASTSTRLSRHVHKPDLLEHRFVFTYREPRIIAGASGRFNYLDERSEEVQFNIQRRSVILGLDRAFGAWLRTSLQWELEFRNPFDIQLDPGELNPIDERAARFGSIATIVDADFRDNVLNPYRGSFHRIQFSWYDDALLSEADFLQVFVRNTFFRPIYGRLRVVAAVRAGFSATYGQTARQGAAEIPIEKRFRLGGNASLRGFGRNCVGGLPGDMPENCSDSSLEQAPGGNAVFNYMLDVLFRLSEGFEVAVFTDGGNAYVSNASFNPFRIRTTAGVGLRYNTFFGPLRLDFGIKLDRRTGESFGEIHFAVGHF